LQSKSRCLSPIKRLVLEDCAATRNEIAMSFSAGELRISKSYRYSSVDFEDLKARYGNELVQRVCFHVMALEAIPLMSLLPEELDLGPFAPFHTTRFENLWRLILLKAGGQWRYENGLQDYVGPRFVSSPGTAAFTPSPGQSGRTEALCFCGGGKDSLAMLKLLESAGVAFSAYSYSHPAYGGAKPQLDLVQSLLDSTTPVERQQAEIEDDFARDANYRTLGIASPVCAETPISIFGALPLALQHGYECLVLGNERSADQPNLYWDRAGEFINHQWGKSLEAELLLGEYIRDQLVANVHCFSVLRPMHDPVIFHMLRRYPEAVIRTHSCNHKKPWCRQCVKCAYVGLGFTAYLPADVICQMVPSDLFDNPTNQVFFRELLGLADHRPFECVGLPDETRLAFEVCRSKGLRGRAIDLYGEEARSDDLARVAQVYSEIDLRSHSIPAPLWRCVSPILVKAGQESFEYLVSICGFDRKFAHLSGARM